MEPMEAFESSPCDLQDRRYHHLSYIGQNLEVKRSLELRYQPYQDCAFPVKLQDLIKKMEASVGNDPTTERYECSIFPTKLTRRLSSIRHALRYSLPLPLFLLPKVSVNEWQLGQSSSRFSSLLFR